MQKQFPCFLFLFSLFLLFLFSCKKPQYTDSEFFIPVEHSRLFVRVAGNEDKPLLIYLHGGPGGFSGFTHESFRKYLEEDYLLVYLDQRGCGKSDTCRDTNMLTMEQYVKDLDVVIDTLFNRYEGKNINLIGGSWGGTYGLLYLIAHPQKVSAFICFSGKADSRYQNKALIQFEREKAKSLLAKTTDRSKIKQYRHILSELDRIAGSDLSHFYEDVGLLKHIFPEQLGINLYWHNKKALAEAERMGKDSAVYRRAHYSRADFKAALARGEAVNRAFRNTAAYNHLDITDQMSAIQTPVCVLQGEYDHDVGVKQARIIYDALTGLPEDKKEIHIIPDAAHNLNMEAPEAFFGFVKRFLAKYN